MFDLFSKHYLLIVILLVATLFRQDGLAQKDTENKERAIQEISIVLSEADSIKDKNDYVKVQGKVANLIWLFDKDRARLLFSDLWQWIGKQDGKAFNTDLARNEFLRYLMPRDPTMAKKLLDEFSGNSKDGEKLRKDTMSQFAADMLNSDPRRAAEMIEQSELTNPSLQSVSLLMKLREKDWERADSIALGIINSLKVQQSQVSLPILYSFHYYFFPSITSTQNNAVPPPNDLLQKQYFLATYAILRNSVQVLMDTGSSTNLSAKSSSLYFIQTQLASILGALAGRFAPESVAELSNIRVALIRMASQDTVSLSENAADRVRTPAERKQLSDNSSVKENPLTSINTAISVGDFEEAERLLENLDNPKLKAALFDRIKIEECEEKLRSDNFPDALRFVQEVVSFKSKVDSLIKIVKKAHQHGDIEFALKALNETQSLISKSDCDEKKLLAMFSLASETSSLFKAKSVEILQSCPDCINSVINPENVNVSKPASLPIIPELARTFFSVGGVDLDSTLLITSRIRQKTTQLTAKLFACENWLQPRENKIVPVPLAAITAHLIVENENAQIKCDAKRKPNLEEQFFILQAEDYKQKLSSPKTDPSSEVRAIAPDRNGEFSFHDLTNGQYRLLPKVLDETYYLRSITTSEASTLSTGNSYVNPNLQDVSRVGINIKSGEKLKVLTVKISDGAATLAGRIKAENNMPSANIHIFLVPAEREKAEDVLRYAMTSTSTDNKFRLINLAPGKYFILTKIGVENTSLKLTNAADYAKIRREAETAKVVIELQPCQKLLNYELIFRK